MIELTLFGNMFPVCIKVFCNYRYKVLKPTIQKAFVQTMMKTQAHGTCTAIVAHTVLLHCSKKDIESMMILTCTLQ